MHKVYFIGAGPGDPGLITVRGQELIAQADLVLYAGSLVPKAVLAAAGKDAQVIDSAPLNLEETHALIMDTVRAGGLAVRVHTGEPSLYGAVREQAELLRRDGVKYEIIPGVTAAFAAAARAEISFTVPEITQTLILTRMSGRTPVPESESISTLAAHGSSLAVYLSADKAAELAKELRKADTPEDTVIVIGLKVGHPGEKIIRTTLSGLEQTARDNALSRQAVFLILPGENVTPTASRLYAADFGHGFRKAVRPATWSRMAVYAMTSQGLNLARTFASSDEADIFVPKRLAAAHTFTRLADQVRANFDRYHAHVFIAATGIVVRTIAPLLDNKTTDPAVVVCDQNGEHVISLLAGHLGGANDLARRIAARTGGRAVITTATDTAGRSAVDILARQHDMTIIDPSRIVEVNAALAEGETIVVYDPENRLKLDPTSFIRTDDPTAAQVYVTWKKTTTDQLILHPPCLIAGVGCRRGVTENEILQALDQVFTTHNLARPSLMKLASADLKSDETGLLTAAQNINLPIDFFDRAVLEKIVVPNPSNRVMEKIGVESVCEAAALHAAQNAISRKNVTARLIVPKTICGSVTIAVALAG
jgi:precorrin-4 C11-methyltransferase